MSIGFVSNTFGTIDFICDECGDETTIETNSPDCGVDFKEGAKCLKEEGWRIFKDNDEWKHYCQDCKQIVRL